MSKFSVLCVGPHYPATASRYLFDAFGEVTSNDNLFRIGPTYNDHYGVNWGEYEVRPHVEIPRENPEWDIDEYIDLFTANYAAPDLVLIAEENYKTVIKHTNKVPTVLLSYDGWPNSFARREEICPTLAYTVHPYGVRPHPQPSIPDGWKMLLPACDPGVHKFYIPFEDHTLDFVLLATMYGKRPALCDYLKNDKTINVYTGTVNTYDYVYAHNHAKTTYHNCCYQDEIKYRFFEAAAMGTVNISDYTQLFDEVGLTPNVHYLHVPITERGDDPYPDFKDIHEQVLRMKKDKAVYRFIARNAYEWVMANHTYYHRVKTIFNDLGMYGEAAMMHGALSKIRKTI